MAKQIDGFVRGTLKEQYERAVGFLKTHRKKLDELAKILMQQETMSVEEFTVIFDGKKPESKKDDGAGEGKESQEASV